MATRAQKIAGLLADSATQGILPWIEGWVAKRCGTAKLRYEHHMARDPIIRHEAADNMVSFSASDIQPLLRSKKTALETHPGQELIEQHLFKGVVEPSNLLIHEAIRHSAAWMVEVQIRRGEVEERFREAVEWDVVLWMYGREIHDETLAALLYNAERAGIGLDFEDAHPAPVIDVNREIFMLVDGRLRRWKITAMHGQSVKVFTQTDIGSEAMTLPMDAVQYYLVA